MNGERFYKDTQNDLKEMNHQKDLKWSKWVPVDTLHLLVPTVMDSFVLPRFWLFPETKWKHGTPLIQSPMDHRNLAV